MQAYQAGQHGLLGLFMGEVVQVSDRKDDLKKTMALLKKAAGHTPIKIM